jgi:hypothetical protein
MIEESSELRLYQAPELDIVTYFPSVPYPSLSAIDTASDRLLRESMTAAQDPVYLSVLRTDADAFLRRHPDTAQDASSARVLRSVLIKPEAEGYLEKLHARVEELAANAGAPIGHAGFWW